MQGTIQKYVLDMADGKKNAPLRVKQYDTNSRWASISLTAFGEPWPVPAGCRACIAVKKTDGTSVLNDCTVEDSNTVLAPITDQTTAVQGIQQAELYFLAVDGDIKSQTFPINVYPAIMDQRVIESSDEFGTLQTAIIGAQEATRTAQDAAAEAMVQAGEARDAAEIAMDAAASIDVAVQAAAAAKMSETNAKASETAAAQSKADVEAMKVAFAGYNKTESGRKYANALTTMKEGDGQVVVTDAWEAPVVNLEVDGASEQVVTTGAQLLDASKAAATNGATVKNNGNKITLSGTNAYAALERTIPIGVVANKTLTLSGKIISQTNQSGKAAIQAALTLADNTIQYNNVTSAGGKVTFNVPVDAKGMNIRLISNNTSTALDTPNTVVFADVMLNIGTTALPWEPYTGGKPSPSPEYPQEIESVAHVANSGAQLLNLKSRAGSQTKNGITLTINDDGSVKVNGTATDDATFALSSNGYMSLDVGKNYAIKGYGMNTDNNFYWQCWIKDPVGWFKDTGSGATFLYGKKSEFNFAVIVESGKTVNATFWPMLNAGSTPIPWEPYNGQQREIDFKVESSGKNLFDKSAAYSYNVGAVDIVQLDRGIRISNATARTYACAAVKLKLKPHTTYTFSGDITALAYKSMIGIRKSIDGGSSFIPDMVVAFSTEAPARGVGRTFTTDENEYYALCLLCTNDVATTGTTTFENIQLEEGSKSTAWEPYTGYQKVTIPIAEPIRGIGDVKDRLCMRDGVWGIERQFVKIGLDGSENWEKETAYGNEIFRFKSTEYKSVIKTEILSTSPIKIMCDRLMAGSSAETYKRTECISSNIGGNIYIYLDAFSSGDVDTFKAYLAEHPITAIFERATPLWEPFPEDIQADLNALATHPGTTYLTVTSTDISAPMRLEYVQDTRKVIEGLQLDMAEQMVELQAQIDQLKVTNNLS
ncbi:hypothetical protein V3C10_04375 [[Clostridium] symbiosum]|uniref:BppU family phage baseplate upper protein n=1 Tax=Clostridium symbiosum TaxID=1512 RepID=UPI001D082378|nr:hypothetical protein [[Clostridium] symbiosum]MCB6610180.1 hypothetical protein [[Clostridium] symbiosum]MCB6933516.1 hypothetical protein [[Clostridium] symbiosum]